MPPALRPAPWLTAFFSAALACASAGSLFGRQPQTSSSGRASFASSKQAPSSKPSVEQDELQQALANSGNDRVALVRNLEDFLKKHPESPQRPQIYRALVEACLQLQDSARAANYAERIVALRPDDMSMTLLAIQLLERGGDEAGLRRAVSYSTRVLDYLARDTEAQKSPKVSKEDWEAEDKRNRMSVLLLRGRLSLKLHDTASAEKDFDSSYALLPNAGAAEKLGEIAELNKEENRAILEYARAFALAEGSTAGINRREIRQKLGNVWRLAHGSEAGLGEYLLHTYDDLAIDTASPTAKRNAGVAQAFDFILRKAPEGSPFPLAADRGKVLVVNFWATWCGPCRVMEPLFAHVAAQFQALSGVVFLAADCDEDETLVPPYLEQEKPHITVVYADGLDRFFAVRSFPTLLVIDREGKVSYRSEGFDPDSIEEELTAAIRRSLPSPTPTVGSAAQSANPTP